MDTAKRDVRLLLRRSSWIVALLLLVIAASPWLVAMAQRRPERPPLKVVATIAPLADWARQVGREHVAVRQLVPINTDPTTYSPSDADRLAIAQADVLIFNGLQLEPWLDQLVEQAAPEKIVTLELARFVGPTSQAPRVAQQQQLPAEDQSNSDQERAQRILPPYVESSYLWLDPGSDMAQRSVLLIADTFARVDPDGLAGYRRNAEQYNGELENLDNWIRREIRTWPRFKVSSRPLLWMQMLDKSWRYFAVRYSINLREPGSLNSSNTTLPASLPLFVDSSLQAADQLKAIGLRQPDGVLRPLGNENYLQLMRDNVTIMTEGMRRAARNTPVQHPEPGFNLR